MRRINTFYGLILVCSVLCTIVLQAQSAIDETDYGLMPPVINNSPLPKYDYSRLDYGMARGIAHTLKNRIWASWVAGGDDDNAFLLLNKSDDGGTTWSKPLLVIESQLPGIKEKRRNRVGCLWLDPAGKLWLFFDQSMTSFDGRAGLWYITCNNPDSDNPQWSSPVRIWHGSALNKPVVLSNGDWMLPVTLWDRGKIKDPYKNAYIELDTFRMAHAFISTDQGKTWQRQGGVRFPSSQFDEHHIMQRRDGSLWMTARTGDGIWESFSNDNGLTWSTPGKYMEHISSRHFIQKLKSGKWLLVRHGNTSERTSTRSKLMAFLSSDEGQTWQGGLMLDERRGVSYPDGFESVDGTIYISYDRNRNTDGEILMARFTEKDVLSKRFSQPNSKAKILIAKPGGLDKMPHPSLD